MLTFKFVDKEIVSCSFEGITIKKIFNEFKISYKKKTNVLGDGFEMFFDPEDGHPLYPASWDWWMSLGESLVFHKDKYIQDYFESKDIKRIRISKKDLMDISKSPLTLNEWEELGKMNGRHKGGKLSFREWKELPHENVSKA